MPLSIFHGDNLPASRLAYRQSLDQDRFANRTILSLDGTTLEPQNLESSLHTQNLYSQESLAIENLFSRPKSKAQSACLKLLANYQGPKNIYLWEKKELTKTQLKHLPHATAFLHKTPVIIFQLLDSLEPGNYPQLKHLLDKSATSADESFLFIMLARRISDLIAVKSGHTAKLSPWILSKLNKQARNWHLPDLLTLHQDLTEFDFQVKTGRTKLSYLDKLDLTLAAQLL